MDVFSHTLWGYGLFGQKRPWLAMAMGAMPDMISFGAFVLLRVVNGEYVPGKPDLEIIPAWSIMLYDLSHSLLISLLLLALVYRLRPGLAFAMLAWPFHIMLDIPFHTCHYFPTKFLYPLNDIIYDGIAWSRP
mgnify:FL=1